MGILILTLALSSCLILYTSLLSLGLICVLFKISFFLNLVLLEVSLLLILLGFCFFLPSIWFFIPIMAIGACESSAGLSLSILLSRTNGVLGFSV